MISKLVHRQLRLFIVITALAISIMATYYVKIPAQLGIGRYSMTVELPRGGGLYPKSLVTYRGYEIGQVRSVTLADGGGVVAKLQIDDSAHVPADAIAQVQSASVIGEQYINFLPPANSKGSARLLGEGSVVPANQTELPTTTDDLLNSVDGFLKSVPTDDLTTVVNELGAAFDKNAGEALGRIIDSGSEFTAEATRNLKPTTDLITSLKPVLSTQADLDPSIRAYAKSLDQIAAQLQKSDNDLRSVLATGSPFVNQVAETTTALREPLVGVVKDLASTSEVLHDFTPSIEHLLIIFPAIVPMLASGVPAEKRDDPVVENNVYFKMTFPTTCVEGFPEAGKPRSPYDLTLGKLPQDSYCKVPSDSPLVVRGARNNPCPQDQARRSAFASGCGLIYDSKAATREGVLNDGIRAPMLDPAMARFIAPNGPFFLLDPAAERAPATLVSLVGLTVTR